MAPALRGSPILGTLFKMIFNVVGLRDLRTGPSRELTYFLMVKSLIVAVRKARRKDVALIPMPRSSQRVAISPSKPSSVTTLPLLEELPLVWLPLRWPLSS